MTVSKNINTKKTIGMINNNNKSQLFQCKCLLCVSQSFLSSEVQTRPICIFKRKQKKRKRRERKELKTCHIMLCTANNRGWRVRGKLEPPAKANPGGSIWEPGWGVEWGGARRVLLCTASSSLCGDGLADGGGASCPVGERGADQRGKERGKRPDSSQDGDVAEYVTSSLPCSGKRGEGGVTNDGWE